MADPATTTDTWPTEAGGYELVSEIGSGAFAKVWSAYCPERAARVAIKMMSLEHITSEVSDILNEVQSMKSCKHPNVLNVHVSFNVDSQLWIVMPLMDHGSCHRLLRKLRQKMLISEKKGFREAWIAAVLADTLQGLKYMHSKHIIHRDIKAGNILVDSSGEVRIADFGVAGWMTEFGSRTERRDTFVGTPCWMAPEVMDQHSGYNEKADIWSVGITALELARGYAPYANLQPMQVLIKTLNEKPPSLESYPDHADLVMSSAFKKFVADCLQRDPAKRPSAEALLKHKFFKNSDRNKEIMMEEMVSKTEGVDVDAVESGPKPTILPDGTVVQPIGKDSFRVTPAEPSKKTFDATKEEVQKLTEMALASRGAGGDQWVFTCSEDVIKEAMAGLGQKPAEAAAAAEDEEDSSDGEFDSQFDGLGATSAATTTGAVRPVDPAPTAEAAPSR